MKKIFFSIFILLAAIVVMAYLYFSKLNADHAQNDNSLYAAAEISGLIFSFENDKSILDILKGQELFQEIVGKNTFKSLKSLKENLLESDRIAELLQKQILYFGIVPGNNKEIHYVISVQISKDAEHTDLVKLLKPLVLNADTLKNISTIRLKDSSVFYLTAKDQLLFLSDAPQPLHQLNAVTKEKKETRFADYIKSNSGFTKNTVAQLYIDFTRIPELLKQISPAKPSGLSGIFHQQNAYAAFSYNYSKDKLLFTGTTSVNDEQSYYQIYSGMKSVKTNISSIFPENTANYIIFNIDHYPSFQQRLTKWFEQQKDQQRINATRQNISGQHHLNPDLLFPEYFKNQFTVFQLSTSGQLGAINLSNGDKLSQLLIDLSEDYDNDLKRLKEPDLLYAYFGMPLKNFRTPYYKIADNYMFFANDLSILQGFLDSYNNDKLLINTQAYANALNQLPDQFNISIYVDRQQSLALFRKNIYPDNFALFSTGHFDTFSYQLSGDQGKFQTNMIFNKQTISEKDSLLLQ